MGAFGPDQFETDEFGHLRSYGGLRVFVVGELCNDPLAWSRVLTVVNQLGVECPSAIAWSAAICVS